MFDGDENILVFVLVGLGKIIVLVCCVIEKVKSGVDIDCFLIVMYIEVVVCEMKEWI